VKRSALLGGMVWSGLVVRSALGPGLHWGAQQLGTIELLFLLGPLVVVPLGLELFVRLDDHADASGLVRAAHWMQFSAALLVAASFFFERGSTAAALVLPWFFVGGLLACHGLKILFSPAPKSLRAACVIASFLYLPIGCAWLIASRFGLNPMSFQEPIVLLTAVHFHFAGFAAPLMTRAEAGALEDSSSVVRRMFNVVATGVLIGPGMLAAGFVVGPRLKLVAALLLVLSEAGLAVLFLVACRRLQPRWARAGRDFGCFCAWSDGTGRNLGHRRIPAATVRASCGDGEVSWHGERVGFYDLRAFGMDFLSIRSDAAK
jgi:hypothetical protein